MGPFRKEDGARFSILLFGAVARLGKPIGPRDLVPGNPAPGVAGFTGAIMSLAFAPDGKTLLASCSMGSIGSWDPLTGKEK
jgi:hypothetical protein